jgi:hypothetical protein
MWRRLAGVGILLAASTACANLVGTRDEGEPPRLVVSVVPGTIEATDSFDVVVRVLNPLERPRTVTSGCRGGLYELHAQGPHPVRLEPLIGCIMQNRDVEIPAQGLEMRSRVRLSPMDRTVLAPGAYTIRASALAWPLDDTDAEAVIHVVHVD